MFVSRWHKKISARRHQQFVAQRRARFRPAIQALEQRLPLAGNVVGYKFLDVNGDGIRNTNIIQGNRPDIVFVVDVSSSTAVGPGAAFVGSPVGDVNSDGAANTILDAELAGFQALTNQLLAQGLGADADVGIILFGGNAVQLDMDAVSAGDQITIPVGRDANSNGLADVIDLLSQIRQGGQGISAGVNGATTDYEEALQRTIQFFNTLGTAPGSGNMVFLTDGQPNDPSTSTAVYADEVNILRSMNINLRAYGAGGTSAVPPLQVIDAGAVRFESTDELLAAFGGLQGPKTVFTEPGIAGVKIWLDIDNDGFFDADEPFTFSVPDNPATVENELGNYIISGVPNGTYTVREDVPVGMIQTAPPSGVGNVVVTGDFNYPVYFGNRPGEIRGVKWLDENGNGQRDQLIVGDRPTVLFVIDVSGSTSGIFQGSVNVGDLNGDGTPNTVLDSEIAGFIALNNSLINSGFGAIGTVSIIAFHSVAFSLDLDPVEPGVQLSTNPLADRDANGVRDVDQALRALVPLDLTDYEAALSLALNVFNTLATPTNQSNLIFLSDGIPNISGGHIDEVAALRNAGFTNLRAFGAGQGAGLVELEYIDPNAKIFNSPDELISLFGGAQTGGGTAFGERGLSGVTVYLDLNDNGVLDPGEPSTVTATDNPATSVDETGTYSFTNLSTGTYVVREVVPAGLYQTYPFGNGSHQVFLGLFGTALATDIDFGNAPPGQISGTKYYDTNRDSFFDPLTEQTLSGVTIYLDLNFNLVRDPGEPTRVTDFNGNYVFESLAPGLYQVREELNPNCNWVQSFPLGGYSVSLAGGGRVRNIDFLNYLATFTYQVGSTLNVCTPDSDDLVGIYQTSSSISVNVNDTFVTLDRAGITNIDVDTAGGNDHITIQGDYAFIRMRGGWGDDVLTGSTGDEILEGGLGDDTLVGGSGGDTYVMSAVGLTSEVDTIVEYPAIGEDLLDFAGSSVGVNVDLSNPSQLAVQGLRTIVAAPGSVPNIESVFGSTLDDILVGNSLSNTLFGNIGADRMTGAGGDDTMAGGPGPDVYVFDADNALGTDVVEEIFGEGSDTLDFGPTTTRSITLLMASTAPQVLNAGLTLQIVSGAIEIVSGTALNDTITGTSSPNTIRGNGGDDTLNGGGGSDSLVGGAGNDRYVFDADVSLGTDTIDETGGGIDTLDFTPTTANSVTVNLSTATVQVVNGFLSLNLGSSTAIENVIGGALADTLTGNTLANVLEGAGGSDQMAGGSGNDSYVFDADVALGTDTIDESGGGVDTLDFSRTTTRSNTVNLATAGAQVVNSNLSLVLSSVTTLENIIGGSLGDTLTGNVLVNTLTGGPGDDSLNGGAASDVYLFDTDVALGTDTIDESAGGTDTLDFSATTTKSISVNLSTPTVQVVNSSLSLILSSGTTIESAIGGSLADTLVGNSLANRLTGGSGDDLLKGTTGDDTYVFDTDGVLGTDTVDEAGGGSDTLDFGSSTTRSVAVNLGLSTIQTVNAGLKLILGSSTATLENVIGSSLNDTITGNSLANRLTGGPGNDSLNGSTGNDTYVFDADSALGSDTINESAGGVDTLDYSATTTRTVQVNLATATSQVVNSNHTLTLSSATTIENVIGGGLADTLIGNTLANSLTGNAGDDVLRGAAGNDTYLFDTDGTLGVDTIDEAGGGADTLDFSATTTRAININLGLATSQVINAGLSLILSSTTTVENVIGGAIGDTLRGNSQSNRLTGGGGDDSLIGSTGNDTYEFDADLVLGTDTIDESAGGVDTLDFSPTTTKTIAVRLGTATLQNVAADLKLILSSVSTIENAVGGDLADALVGNGLDNELDGGDGDDRLEGLAGNDKMIGGPGNDLYRFDADVASGTDTLDESGGGNDTLDFTATSAGVAVNLGVATVQVVNPSLSLILSATNTIENVLGGSGVDTLTGNSANNILTGSSGGDTISGADGRDVIIGGSNTDTINGGAGEDILIGGNSTHEGNLTALRAIMAEWGRTDQTYAQRIGHLSTSSGGLNGTTLLNATTISNDANTADQLTGAADLDWFFASVGDNTLDVVLALETRTTI